MSFEVGERVKTLPNAIGLPHPDAGRITGKSINQDGKAWYVVCLDVRGSGWNATDESLDFDWDDDFEEDDDMSYGLPPVVRATPIGTSKRKAPVVTPTYPELTGGSRTPALIPKKKTVQPDENFVAPAHHVAPITEAQKILLLIGS